MLSRIMEIMTAVFIGCLIIMLMCIMAVELRKEIKPNVFDAYSKAINECPDDSCRRYANIFYIQVLRDLNEGGNKCIKETMKG